MKLDKNNLPIQILVSHEWQKVGDEMVTVRKDKKWKRLRELKKK